MTSPLHLALLGDPVEHSLSPVMQTAALTAAGIEGTYEAMQVDPVGLGRMAAWLHGGRLGGANITMPYKRLAARLSDGLTPAARRADAVNTWVVESGVIVGHNTDVIGMRSAAGWAGLPEDRPVLVLGAGGAASAALLAFEGRDLAVSARRMHTATDLVLRLGVDADLVAWGTPLEDAVVVNCTPIGMDGGRLPNGLIESAAGYFETVYAAGDTPAFVEAVEMSLPTVSGLDLLVGQGACSFELWTGVAAPLSVMRTAVGI